MSETPTLFLIEDTDLDVEYIERRMRRLGLTNPIVRARDGREALDILEGRGDGPALWPPFVTFVDLNMPRMTGNELLRTLVARRDLALGRVVVLSTSEHPADVQLADLALVDRYITKPISDEDLVDLLS